MGGVSSTPDSGGSRSGASPPSKLGGRSASFRAFKDSYTDLATLQADLRRAGLESCNLIVGIDFTKSNEWTGKVTFQGRNLHALGSEMNPYEQAISIIGETLSTFDDDGLIPAFGFGCTRTGDSKVFSLLPGGAPCAGFPQVLSAYRTIVPSVTLSGPTSFGPLIRHAMSVVKASGGQYHILVIVADGQVTRPSGMPEDELSEQEQDTISSIVEAGALPLSIVMIGVGDGPWDTMEAFDDRIPSRAWDNFQFVALTDTLAAATKNIRPGSSPQQVKSVMEATFAVKALMEIPEQFREVQNRRLLGANSASKVHIRSVNLLDPPPQINLPGIPTGPVGSPFLQAPPGMMMPGGGGGGPQQQQHQQQQPQQQQQQFFAAGVPQQHFQQQQHQFFPASAGASPNSGGGGSQSYGGAVPIPHGYVVSSGGILPGQNAFSVPGPGGGGGGGSGWGGPGPNGGINVSPVSVSPGEAGWMCGRCTLVNAGANAKCLACGGERVGSFFPPVGLTSTPSGPSSSSASSSSTSTANSGSNANGSASGNGGGGDPSEESLCQICLERPRDMAFQCGHRTCAVCSTMLQTCPICRATIVTRIKLY